MTILHDKSKSADSNMSASRAYAILENDFLSLGCHDDGKARHDGDQAILMAMEALKIKIQEER